MEDKKHRVRVNPDAILGDNVGSQLNMAPKSGALSQEDILEKIII